MENVYMVIIGMALVTYLPRVLPLLFLRNLKLSPNLQRFLGFIPYTILGALIFPGILNSTGSLFPAVVGTLTAFALSWLEVNLLFVVIGSVLTTTLIQLI